MNTSWLESADKWKPRLELLAYLAVILTCALILGEKAISYTQRPPSPLAAGDKFAELGALVPEGASGAFVLMLSPTCKYCTASMPAFRQLVEERNAKGSEVAVIATVHSQTPFEEEERVFQEHSFQPDALKHLETGKVRVRGVPTVARVDPTGKVLQVWQGQVSEQRVQELVRYL